MNKQSKRSFLTPELEARIAEHIANLPPPCEHEFGGWRNFEDGSGGEQVCQKCGMGFEAWAMRMLP
jgi:hypothetical protein